MFNFLFGTSNVEEHKEKFIKVPKKLSKSTDMYIVLHKNTQEPIGIFDDLDQAITAGKLSTYCNCMIYCFKLNEKCVYLNRPIYEDK